MLLAQITKDQQHIAKITEYCDGMINGQTRTPKHLVFIDAWGSLRHAANAAFMCLEVCIKLLHKTNLNCD